ncbi:hypothetical protein SAMN04490204_2538 [Pseudomonas thivervalensis]|nr:hypothetical protein SAMN04490204_2538 [Pseudomonas thivervalensis]
MDGWPPAEQYPSSAAVDPVGKRTPAIVPSLSALPSELAFWALWHCRHARPPDTRISC